MLDDGSYVVEIITLLDVNLENEENYSLYSYPIYGTCSLEKKHDIENQGEIIATAKLSASFKFNEEKDYISCTSKKADYSTVAGNSSYFKNKTLTEDSGGGLIFDKYITVKMTYTYGLWELDGSLSIKCTSAGKIS